MRGALASVWALSEGVYPQIFFYYPINLQRNHDLLKAWKKWLTFARQYQNWIVQMWSTVLFTDESSVQQFSSCASGAHRLCGQRYDDRYKIPTVKHYPSQMIRDAMSIFGTALFYISCRLKPLWTKVGTLICYLISKSFTWVFIYIWFSCMMGFHNIGQGLLWVTWRLKNI